MTSTSPFIADVLISPAVSANDPTASCSLTAGGSIEHDLRGLRYGRARTNFLYAMRAARSRYALTRRRRSPAGEYEQGLTNQRRYTRRLSQARGGTQSPWI